MCYFLCQKRRVSSASTCQNLMPVKYKLLMYLFSRTIFGASDLKRAPRHWLKYFGHKSLICGWSKRICNFYQERSNFTGVVAATWLGVVTQRTYMLRHVTSRYVIDTSNDCCAETNFSFQIQNFIICQSCCGAFLSTRLNSLKINIANF